MEPWFDIAAGSPGGALLRSAWQPVYRDVDLAPGQLRRLVVLGEELALFRTSSGQAWLVDGRCPHRGTRLDLGRLEEERLVCAHHGWCWSGDGRPRAAHAGQTARGLRSLPLREAHGLLFAWFGQGEPPPLELPPGPWTPLAPNLWPCSFFRRLENTLDLSHVPHSHRLSVGGGMRADLDGEPRRVEGGLEVHEPGLPVVSFQLPNRLRFASPHAQGWVDHLVWRVPQDVDSCLSFALVQVDEAVEAKARPFRPSPVEEAAETVLRGERRLEDLASHPSLTEIEDYVVLVGQGTLASQPRESLGPADGPVRALREIWREACS